MQRPLHAYPGICSNVSGTTEHLVHVQQLASLGTTSSAVSCVLSTSSPRTARHRAELETVSDVEPELDQAHAEREAPVTVLSEYPRE